MREREMIDTKRIRLLLIERNKTLIRFAQDMGYSYGWIIKIVNNKEHRYDPSIIDRLAIYLGVDRSELLTNSLVGV